MKQVLQNLRSGETLVADVPAPVARHGTVLVRTAASLVSAGTERMVVEFAGKSLVGKARSRPDLVRQVLDKARREGLLSTIETAFNRLDQPMALGYSSAGTIVELGEGVEGWRVGQRVACAGGGYAVHAEFAVVPLNLLALLPDEVEFEPAAFATLGAIALHGFRLAEAQVGERVAVIGLGLLGLLTASIAQAAGCSVLGIDIDPERTALGIRLGLRTAQREHAEEAAQSFARGRGCDAVLICADTPSADPVELAGVIARDRAQVVAVGSVGLSLPRKLYYEKELFFVNSRSYGPGRYDPAYEEGGQDYPLGYVRWTEGRNLEAFVDLLAQKRLDVSSMITHRFPIEKASQAYELITGKMGEKFLGVLLTYPQMNPPLPKAVVSSPAASAGQAQIRVGVLGAGNFASAVMLPALQKTEGVELVGIASGSGLSAGHAARKYGFRYAASHAGELFKDSEINTIAVLTRHHLHASQVLAALKAGKHVFCEKPLALNREQLSDVRKQLLSVKNSPLLMVGFNRRFAPLAVRLHQFLRERAEPVAIHYRVNAGYIPANHWVHDPEQGGGRIIGEACHFVDFLTFLIGACPALVSAQGLPGLGRYHEDNAVMTFSFPDGSVGTLSYLANGDRSFAKERVEVFTGGRVAVLDDFRSLEMVHNGRQRVVRSRLRQDKGHQAEWAAFVTAIRNGGLPPIPYEQIFSVHRAVYAALDSLRSGKILQVDPPSAGAQEAM